MILPYNRSVKLTRRVFLQTAAAGTLLATESSSPERIKARPSATAPVSLEPGQRALGLRDERDALLYVPESSAKFESAPLVISLHGATRNADRGIALFKDYADEHGFLLLAPASRDTTWDGIGGEIGPDLLFIDMALEKLYGMRRIDPARIAMAGFSDGASYSLSIGLDNGDLFAAVFGFSPGFVIPGEHRGKPPVFMSHGTVDPILPIEFCSRRIVPQLRHEGYRVNYREFEGKHTLPPEIGAAAMKWFMDGAKG